MNCKLQRLILPFLIMLCTAYKSQAVIRYVDATANGSNNGSSWVNAYTALGEALYQAHVNTAIDTILVAQGTYYPTRIPPTSNATTDRDKSFYFLRDRLVVLGGYASGGATRNHVANPTILSGNLANLNDSTDNAYHVVLMVGAQTNHLDSLLIDGFTIEGGNADGSSFINLNVTVFINRVVGGGVHSTYASPTIRNTTITRNWAALGGGMYIVNSSAQLTKTIFSDNRANTGGGIIIYSSNPLLDSCIFANNTATEGGGMQNESSTTIVTNSTFSANVASNLGGGMANSNSNAELTNVTFVANTAQNSGGGMSNVNSSPIITNSAFTANMCLNGVGGGMANSLNSAPVVVGAVFSNNTARFLGGGMNNNNSFPIIDRVKFVGNSAQNYGGGMSNANSTPLISNSVFSANTTTAYGGGMQNDNSNPQITNTVFSGNKSNYAGGAMYNHGSSPKITNSVFSGNSASSFGGVMYNFNSSAPNIANSIIYGNSSTFSSYNATALVTHSIVQDGYGGNSSINPQLANAPSHTLAPFSSGDYHLQPCSPAINAGYNDSVPASNTTDLDGNSRIAQGRVDLGAYEFHVKTIITHVDSICQGSVYQFNGNSYTATGMYIYDTLKYNAGCDSVYLVLNLKQNLTPNLTVSQPSQIFHPGSINLFNTIASDIPVQYSYYNSSFVALPNSVVNGVGVITYKIIGSTTSGCSDTATVTVIINPVSNIRINQPAAVCQPNSIALQNTIGNYNNSSTYFYYHPNGSLMTGSNPTATSSGGFKIVERDTNNNYDTAYVNVVINAKPIVVTHNPTAKCAPNTTDITLPAVTAGSSAGLNFTYWSNAAATQSISYTAAQALSNTGSKLYYLVGTSDAGCTDTTNVLVTFYAKPTVVAYNPQAVCTGSTVNLKSAAITYGSTANLTYSYWNSAHQNVTATANAITLGGAYSIVGANSAGCTDTATVVVVFNNCGSNMANGSSGGGSSNLNDEDPTGIGQMQQVLVKLYPNPTSNVLFFECESYQAGVIQSHIIDATGRILNQKVLQTTGSGNQNFNIDVKDLPSGIYYFYFQLPESRVFKAIKFVVNH